MELCGHFEQVEEEHSLEIHILSTCPYSSVVYSDLYLIEGTTVDFICPPGLVLDRTMSATCMTNGEWEPEPQNVMCIEG